MGVAIFFGGSGALGHVSESDDYGVAMAELAALTGVPADQIEVVAAYAIPDAAMAQWRRADAYRWPDYDGLTRIA